MRSLGFTGRKHSAESRKKMSLAQLGRKLSETAKQNIARAKLGDKNPYWKGDGVGYAGVHAWVKRWLRKPELCQICLGDTPYDLANISGEYHRDLSDWHWLCRGCHMKSDGRINNLVQFQTWKN